MEVVLRCAVEYEEACFILEIVSLIYWTRGLKTIKIKYFSELVVTSTSSIGVPKYIIIIIHIDIDRMRKLITKISLIM